MEPAELVSATEVVLREIAVGASSTLVTVIVTSSESEASPSDTEIVSV